MTNLTFDQVSLLFPPSLLSPAPLLSTLKEQLAHRGPHHKQAMIKCLLVAPLTFPFAIIPLVPNFPLFYVLWRAWSHYRGRLLPPFVRADPSIQRSSLPSTSPSFCRRPRSTSSPPPSWTRFTRRRRATRRICCSRRPSSRT